MDHIWLSSAISVVSNDALVCYAVMRAECQEQDSAIARHGRNRGLLLAAADTASLSQRMGVSTLTVERCVKELIAKEWVSHSELGYQLGVMTVDGLAWFVDRLIKPKARRHTEDMRDAISRLKRDEIRADRAEAVATAGHATERVALTLGLTSVAKLGPKDVIATFRACFRSLYGREYLVSWGRDTRACARIIELCQGNVSTAIRYVEYVFANWAALEPHMNVEPIPTSLSVDWVFLKACKFKEAGEIPPAPELKSADTRHIKNRTINLVEREAGEWG